MASFTRIIEGLNEVDQGPLSTDRFIVSRSDDGWMVAPSALRDPHSPPKLNGVPFASQRTLRDDDPLGKRIKQHHGQRQSRPPISILTLAQEERPELDVEEEHGLIRRLRVRRPALATAVLAMLHQRRARFLEHLTIDESWPGVGQWVEQLERCELPRWLKTISFGGFLGAAPDSWTIRSPTPRLRERCPLLSAEPMVRWNVTPTIEVVTGLHRVRGVTTERATVMEGTVIEASDDLVHVHHDAPRDATRSYVFRLHQQHVFLMRSDAVKPAQELFHFPGRRLFHGDEIELAPDVLLRFSLISPEA